MADRMDFVTGGKVDAVHFIDDITEEIPVDHAIDCAAKDRGDHVTAVSAIGALQTPEIGEEAGAFLAVGADGFIIVHELDQLVAGDAVWLGGPIPPTIGRLDRRAEALAGELGVGFADLLQIVEKLQEHDPSQHGQAVEIAIEPLVLAHDVARGLDQRTQLLSRRQWHILPSCLCHKNDLGPLISDDKLQNQAARLLGGSQRSRRLLGHNRVSDFIFQRV